MLDLDLDHFHPRAVYIVTNSVGVAAALAGAPGLEVTLTGGTLRGSLELFGPLAEQSLRNLYVDTAFIGVDGLTARHGLTTYNQVEAYINRIMIGQARRAIVVVDHTKIGRVMMALIAPVRDVVALVTDAAAPRAHLDELRAARGAWRVACATLRPRSQGSARRPRSRRA